MTTIHSDPVRIVVLLLAAGMMTGLGAGPAAAQSGARSTGAVATGGGTSALDTGPAALYANPAALTVGPVTHNLELELLRVSTYVGGDVYQFDHYRTLFVNNEGAGALSDAEEASVLADWFGDGQRSASTYVEVMPLAFTYRPDDGRWAMGLGLRGRTIQKTGMNKGLIDLLLRGTSPSRTVPVNGRSRVYSTADVTGAFSYRLSSMPLSIGVAPRLILGLGYSGLDLQSTARVSGDSLVHRFDYTAQAAGGVSTGLYDSFDAFSASPIAASDVWGSSSGVAGVGGGIDVGATYTVRSGLHVSMSITDLGRIQWSKNAQTVTPESNVFRFDGVTLNQAEGDLGEQIETQIDSLLRDAYEDVERDRSSFSTGLPTTLHLSSTWDPGVVVVNGGISVGLNDAAGAVPEPAAVHLGSTLQAGPIPLRAGVRLWGTQAVTVSGGLGLDLGAYRLDLGGSVTPSTSTLGSGARYAISLSLGTLRI